MKILSLFYGEPGRGSEWERVKKLHEIISSEHSVDLVVYSPRSATNDGFDIDFEVKRKSKFRSLIHSFRNLNVDGYDMVFGNNSLGALISISSCVRAPVYDIHGGLLEEHSINREYAKDGYTGPVGWIKYLIKFIMEYLCINRCKKLTVVSENMKNRIVKKWDIDPKNIYVIPNCVDVSDFNPTSKPALISDKLIFGYIGGFNYWQGTVELLESARNHNSSEFLFVGEEREDEDNIKFVGRVAKEKVQSYYSASDVLVLPRPSHPATDTASPTKFAEYAAMGKPILTTNVGKPARLVQKYNCGIVVDNTDRLISGFKKFESKSDKEIARMGARARDMAEEKLDITLMENKIKNMLSTC